ncbi:MAG: isoprenylcysteine carboxylmethyltransferase family protein [Solirubrobacterales bacterium]|nr:isoprenylcysteine carboxylmethyltransferase family protein [Solirubrobacterales bacterium]
MAVLSAALIAAFLLIVFPLRSLRRRLQFGSAARATYGRTRPPLWWVADLLFLAGFGLVLAGPILQIVTETTLLFDPVPVVSVIALTGVVLATGLSVWSQETMGAAWRPDIGPADQAALVATGPFRFVRNPNYVAMLAAAFWATLLAPTLIGFAGVFVLLVSLVLTSRAEEPLLIQTYGAPYREYAARTGRFFPRIGLIHEDRS